MNGGLSAGVRGLCGCRIVPLVAAIAAACGPSRTWDAGTDVRDDTSLVDQFTPDVPDVPDTPNDTTADVGRDAVDVLNDTARDVGGDSSSDASRDACPDGGCMAGCAAGSVLVSGVCTPIARQIAPLSTSTVTSHTPTLRWRLASGYDGAHVDVCHDRACTRSVATFDVTGTSRRLASPLASGVYFWRIRGSSGGTLAMPSGITWQFRVGAEDAPVDTSWGTSPDFNGDGLADVGLEGSAIPPDLSVYLSSGAAGFTGSPLSRMGDTEMSGSLTNGGDVNGDGFADIIAESASATSHLVQYFGGPSGASTIASVASPTGSIAAAGDVDGDGYGDVVVGDDAYDSLFHGHAYILRGGPAGLQPGAIDIASPAGMNGRFGYAVASAGDLNGDGFGDLVVGAPGDAVYGQVYLYLGSTAGIATTPAVTLAPAAESCPVDGATDATCEFGESVSSAGDTNGDGYCDVLIGEPWSLSRAGRALLYNGGATPSAITVSGMFSNAASMAFGYNVSGAGDLDGDGRADVVIGAPNESAYCGAAYVYLHRATGWSTGTHITAPGCLGLGSPVAAGGDLNGDGYDDVWIVGSGVSSATALGYYGASSGVLATTPDVTFTGRFFVAIAAASP